MKQQDALRTKMELAPTCRALRHSTRLLRGVHNVGYASHTIDMPCAASLTPFPKLLRSCLGSPHGMHTGSSYALRHIEHCPDITLQCPTAAKVGGDGVVVVAGQTTTQTRWQIDRLSHRVNASGSQRDRQGLANRCLNAEISRNLRVDKVDDPRVLLRYSRSTTG